MIREFYRLLGSNPIEIRSLTQDGKWVSEYVTNEDDFLDAVESKNGKHVGVYASLQQLKNQGTKVWENGEHRPISASDVEKYTTLIFDFDPVRNGAATPEQTQLALDRAKALKAVLEGRGWPEGFLMISGNGAYLGFKVNVPKEDKHLIHGCLLSADSLFSDDKVKVDTTLASEGQIIRIPGTLNRKVPDDPREAKLLTFFEVPPKTVSRKLIEKFAVDVEEVSYPLTKNKTPLKPIELEGRVADVAVYLKNRDYHTVEKKQRYRTEKSQGCVILKLNRCPGDDICSEKHTGPKETYVYIWDDGSIGFKCFSDKHNHLHFKNLEAHFGEKFDAKRTFNDPYKLGEAYLEENRFLVVKDRNYRYTDRWIEETDKTAKLNLRRFIQEKFDEHAKFTPSHAKHVGTQCVSNTLAAVQSLAHRPTAPEQVPPFFLTDHEWAAEDVLLVANGLLNIRKYVEGKPFFIEPTWKFFTPDVSEVVYDPAAQCPTWRRFLDSLERSPEFVQTINEMIASAVWDGMTHQVIHNLFGQGGAGKNVITDVATGICHGRSASVYLKDLTTDKHVLQDAPGKKLILFPESRVPRGKEREVVSILKSMTGRDKVPINPKNDPLFSTVLTGTFISQTNEILRFDDPTNAFNRRLIPLPFAKSWREDSDNKPDPELPAKLKAEYSGILNVVLEAARTLHERGRFLLPPEAKPFLASSRDDSNPIADFQRDHLEYRPGSAVQGAAVHSLFIKWAAKNGVSAMREQDLYSAIREAMSGQVTLERMTSATAREQHGRTVQQTKYNQDARKRLFLDLYLKEPGGSDQPIGLPPGSLIYGGATCTQ